MGSQAQAPPTRTRFFSDVAVQTDSMALGMGSLQTYGPLSAGITERQQSKLNADDLWAILKSSQDISSDINLSSGELLDCCNACLLSCPPFSLTAPNGSIHRWGDLICFYF
jgi:hypothetical protein